MRKLMKGNITQKIILILVIAILCNFAIPNYSHADVDGGVLLDPIKMFIAFVGDAAISAVNYFFIGEWIGASDAKAHPSSPGWEDDWVENWDKEIDWPTILISPEEIFAGKVLALNVNFLKEISGDSVKINRGEEVTLSSFRDSLKNDDKTIGTTNYETALTNLRAQISKWYILIRNLAASLLLCILIYIGIRMVISSASEEKAKYKSMMINWLVAICLVFFLHYMMSAIMFITENLVNIMRGGLDSEYIVINPGSGQEEIFWLSDGATAGEGGIEYFQDGNASSVINSYNQIVSNFGEYIPKVYNLLELTRVYVSLENRMLAFVYLLVYLVLIVYTLIFIFKYLKRFMYMAFLTLIAPVIAVTYPIDKMNDGSAQAFNAWLKEYLFNALLQPLHLLVYVVLVGTAIDLVQTNFIYTIVALFFINKAEEILRGFFGFNKASTAGGGAGAFAKGALASQALNRIKSSGNATKSIGTKNSGGTSGNGGSKPRQVKGLDAYVGTNDKAKLNNKDGKEGTPRITGGFSEELGPHSKDEYRFSEAEASENFKTTGEQSGKSKAEEINEYEQYLKDRGINPESDQQKEKGLFENQQKDKEEQAKFNEIQQPKKKIKGPYNKTKRGAIAGMAKNAGKAIGKGAWKATKYTGKKIGRGAIRTVAAVPGAMIGGAMAIATGNKGYLAAGAGIGYALGGKAADALGKAPGAIKSSYRKERLGAQGAAAKARYDEFKKNEDNIKYFKEEYGVSTKEAKAMIAQGKDFIEAGYTNPEDVDRLIKMQESFQDATPDQIMAADQYASKYGVDYFMDDKKLTTLQDNSTHAIMAEAEKKGHTIDEASARKMAQKHINMMASSKGMSSIDFDARRKNEEIQAEKQEIAAKREEAKAKREEQFQQAIIDIASGQQNGKIRRTTTRRTSAPETSAKRTTTRRTSVTGTNSKTTNSRNKGTSRKAK